MPGRQYTQHPINKPSSSRPVKRQKNKQRALNAFSIAQHTASDEYIPRRTRLGQIEDAEEGKKHNRDEDDSEDSADEDQPRKKPRRGDQNEVGNNVERGSDSEGNEWVVGVGDEDSEIDSDEAGSDQVGGQSEGEESEDFAAEAVNLGDVLDESSEESEEEVVELGDEDDDGDTGRLEKLRNLLVGLDEQSDKQRSQLDLAQEAATPSEYGIAPRQKLSVADLMATITDPALRKSLKVLAGDGKKKKASGVPGKLSAPLPKRQQDRVDRTAAFEKSKETLNRWIETVKHNRRAEHLVFPLVDQDVEAAKSTKRILPGALPTNDLEVTIQKILADSGLEPGKKQEDEIQRFEELAANKLPIEELRARQAELRKARDLLFYEEIRAKRIKKIKSKAYRRVHRKERERNALQEKDALAQAGYVDSEDEQERLDRRRAEERMGQRHRESRWAKSVKQTGRATWDDQARDGVAAMLKQDEELKRKMYGKDADSGSESDTEPSDEDEGAFTQRMHDKLVQLGTDEPRQESRLSSMKFMQKAEAARRAQNDEALEQLHRELDGDSQMESDSEEDGAAISGRKSFGPKKKVTTAIKIKEKRAEFEEGDESEHEDPGQDDVEVIINNTSKKNGYTKAKGSSKDTENPWITATASTQQSTKNPIHSTSDDENPFLSIKKKPKKQASDPEIIIKNHTTNPPSKPTPVSPPDPDPDPDSDSDSFTGFSPPPLTNRALISAAFANDNTSQTTFTAEKASLTLSEAPQEHSTTSLPGWGSWTGPGLSRKDKRLASKARNQKKTVSVTEGIAVDARRDKALDRVIISEKRVGKNARYLAGSLPFPFESREQYERSIRLPIGPEFGTKVTFQKMTKPRVLVKGGIVRPMRKPLV